MVRRTLGAVVVWLVAAAGPALAADPITVKFREPRAGDRGRVSEDEKTTTVTVVEIGGNKEEKVEKKRRVVVYVEEVITAGGPGAKKPAKAARTYETHEVTTGDDTAKGLLAGKTIVYEKAGDKYTFTEQGGGAVPPAAAAELDREFNRGGSLIRPADLLPAKPAAVGGTWELDKGRLLKDIASTGMEFDAARATATGKLTKAYTKDGKQFGVLDITLKAPVTGIGGKSPIAAKPGSLMTITVTADGCLDGSEQSGTVLSTATFKVDGTIMGATLALTVDSTQTSKREPLPKK